MNNLKALNYPAVYAEGLESLPSKTVLISINNEHTPLFNLKLDRNDKRILTLVFTDITFPIEHKGKTYSPVSQKDAKTTVDFIEKNKNNNFIVNCHAGVSRSSAVCLYIHLKYGHNLRNEFWQVSEPNPQVIGRLFIESKRVDF